MTSARNRFATLFGGWLSPLEHRLVYVGSYGAEALTKQTPADYGLEFEALTLRADDGVVLGAWALPNLQSDLWLLYFHGNGETMAAYLQVTTKLHALGLSVLMLEYRGYGNSQGVPSEDGLYRDAQASYAWLLERGVSPEKIVAYGFSLGSGVAVELARRVPLGALILDAPYTSLPDVARAAYRMVLPKLMKNRFASEEKIADIKTPTLFIHARDDRTVPYSQGETLYKLSPGPKKLVTISGGHVALFNTPLETVYEEIKAFLRAHVEFEPCQT